MALDHPLDALPAGTRVGSYEILRVLGRGGFGITYAARAGAQVGQMVAIKEWFPAPMGLCHRGQRGQVIASAQADPKVIHDALGMFCREAQVICSLDHPHLVQGLDWLELNGTAYLVMSYASGKNLQEHLRTSGGNYRVNPESMSQLCRGILSALACLHGHGLIHGDIKPDNIFLGVGFQPILIDLGSACLHAAMASDAPGTYSQHYSAIEQLNNQYGAVGPWTDIYQFSAVLYRCLAGGKPPDAQARASKQADPFFPLTEQKSTLGDYPVAFLRAIDAGLSLHPRKRPQSIQDWQLVMEAPLSQMAPNPPPLPRQRDPRPIPHEIQTRPAPQTPTEIAPEDLLERIGRFLVFIVLAISLILLARGCAA
jgi:serine/threonine protein kinase